MPCSLRELYTTLADPSVARVHVELPLASLAEVHAELVRIWLFCVAQHHRAEALVPEMLTAAASAEACGLFAKLGVVCHVDEAPPVPPRDPLGAFTSVTLTPTGRHTLAFSLARPAPRACREL
jgi:hypothetical protein